MGGLEIPDAVDASEVQVAFDMDGGLFVPLRYFDEEVEDA